MPIFYPEALRAALTGIAPPALTDEYFDDWRSLSDAMDELSPEQRCDAIYADWLLQLNSPASQALLQVRNLLIGQGALAANYLAELAQNADDASDGREAEVRIVQDRDWLFVANNGRKITALNLLGLCRFFVHAAGKVVDLADQKTIGRFGIGFKSCYRIASEVYVLTWDGEGEFGFRLPVCREGEPDSAPDWGRLNHVLARLQALGVPSLGGNLRDVRRLGYCTPEFLAEFPSHLRIGAGDLSKQERGTLFAFHIRPDRLDDVKSRISGQAHEIYELCPIFLPNVRHVRLGDHQLVMRTQRHDRTNDLEACVKAQKVELKTLVPGEPPSVSRFWRLDGMEKDDLWQVSLHADSQYRLRVEQEEDEHGSTIKDGAAYSHFPLNAVTRTWPFRLHLNIVLPTNLARDDWNPDERGLVENQIRRAISGATRWLERYTERWHPDWNVDDLIVRRPHPNETWASLVWEELRRGREERSVVRTLMGGFVRGAKTRAITLIERPEATKAWGAVVASLPSNDEPPVLVPMSEGCVFELEAVSAGEAAKLCIGAIQANGANDEAHRNALTAFLGCNNLMLHRNPGVLEDVLAHVQCETSDGDKIMLSELLRQPGGAELTPHWHETFQRLRLWSREMSWALATVGGDSMPEQLKKLSEPTFNPPWRVLVNQLSTEAQWAERGEAFWGTPREACPASCMNSALATLRVSTRAGGWALISELWLENDGLPDCFSGLLKRWDRSRVDPVRNSSVRKLKDWGVFQAWERSTTAMLKERLARVLTRRLAENAQGTAFESVFNDTFEESRRRLPDSWKHIVGEAVDTATEFFIKAQAMEAGLSCKTVLSPGIPGPVRTTLALLPGYVSGPAWLTESAYMQVARLGLQAELSLEFLTEQSFRARSERLARELLENFHRWKDGPVSDPFSTVWRQFRRRIRGNAPFLAPDDSPTSKCSGKFGIRPVVSYCSA